MKLSTFIFHVDARKSETFKKIVADYFRYYCLDAEKSGSLTFVSGRLIVVTYDFEWLWSEVSCFVDCVLRKAKEKNILVVCESVKFG